MEIAYLGPEGTFTQQAAYSYEKDAITIAYPTIDEVVWAVHKGEVKLGIVPIENSTEGVVNTTMDMLMFETDVCIKAQITLKISHSLFVRNQTKREDIKKILSHPQGLAQCKKYLQNNFPSAELVSVASTAGSVKLTAESDEPIAAVGNSLAGKIYGLTALHENIQDQNENVTTFVVITKEDTSAPTIGYKTSLVFSISDKPGELYRILDIFAIWDINMTKILSRPMKNKPGEYVFFVDLEGFSAVEDINDALRMVKRKTSFCRVLGSYPVV